MPSVTAATAPIATRTSITEIHVNEDVYVYVHTDQDLFDSKCQSDLLTLIAIKFDEWR